MTTTPINDTSITNDFNVDELTEGTLTGKGVFDVLLQTLRLHLDREFTSGRITGTAYATVYSQAITAFLAQASQYALAKAKMPLELQLLQEQIDLTQKQQDQITAAIRQTDYVTDYQLPSEVANKAKQTELLAYELTNLKPVELSIAQQELALKTAQADLVEYDLTTLKPQELALLQQQVATQIYTVQTRMPAEVANIQAETALKAYELSDVQPANVAQIQAQTSHIVKQELNTVQQTSNLVSQQNQVEAQTALLDYDLTTIKPIEAVNLSKQGTLLDSQTDVTDKQALGIVAETSLKSYELTDIKPTEKDNLIRTGLNITAQTSNTEQNTLNLVKQGHLTDSQKVVADKQALSTEAQTSLLVYDLTDIKPVEKNNLINTGLRTEAETSLLAYDLTDIKPTEKGQIAAETSRITYTTQHQLPEEVELIKRNQIQTTAQTNLVNADTALKVYDLTDIKPNEKAQVIQQTSNLSSQQEQIEAETARTQYQTQYQIPEEIKVIKYNQDKLLAEVDRVATDTAVAIKQGLLVDAQTCDVRAKTNQTNTEVALQLPEQVELIKRNQIQVTAQTAQIEAQSALLDYDLNNVKPVELANLGFTGLGITADTANKTQVTANLVLEGDNIVKQGNLLNSQKISVDKQALNTEAQTAQITYTTSYVLPSQVAQTDAQTAQVTYTTSNILPAQLALTTSQKESSDAQTALYEQKTVTELAQTTTTPASGSVMGVQNDLMATQKASYLRDAEQKAAKMLIDTWNVRHNGDPTGNPVLATNRLRNEDIGAAVGKMLTGIGVA